MNDLTSEHGPLLLGIDLGTSKVAVVVCGADGRSAWSRSRAHEAAIDGPTGHANQDAERILETVSRLLTELPAELRDRLGAVGLTGQMHGVVQHDDAGQPTSPLVTWEDRRTEGLEFEGRWIPAGFGMATLDWWSRQGSLHGPHVATIHGLCAARLCGLGKAPIDPTDVSAWGGWPKLPESLLPERVGHGARIGQTPESGLLPAGLPVAAPLGDNQASIRATVRDPDTELALTIGTGCQLSAVVAVGQIPSGLPRGTEVRPFDEQHALLVAAPRAGGSAWKWLAESVNQTLSDLGLAPLPLPEVYRKLDELGAGASGVLRFEPHLSGERFDPTLTGSLHGLRLENGRLGEIAQAVAHGIPANARSMLPEAVFHGRERVVASGNALRRSALLRTEAERALGLPILLSDLEEEAATGAALVAQALLPSE